MTPCRFCNHPGNILEWPCSYCNGSRFEPERIQRRRVKSWKMPPNTVSVSRPGIWGSYAGKTKADFVEWLDAMDAPSRATYAKAAKSYLRGKNLACYCPLDQPCHADVLLELANS